MNNGVVACIQGAPADRAVCEYGAWAATTLGAPLALLHMLPETRPPAPCAFMDATAASLLQQLEKVENERQRLDMALGEARLAGCAAWLRQRGLASAQLLQKQGSPAVLLEGMADVRLMVFGKEEALNPVGSAVETLIRLHRGAVLAAAGPFTEPRRAMFAWDASNECRKHLATLTASPLLYGMECHLVMVNGNATALQNGYDVWRKAGIRVQAHMLEGTSVTESLHRYAETHRIDLTIMGAYGHSPRRRYFIGRHAAQMLFTSRLPLMLLR